MTRSAAAATGPSAAQGVVKPGVVRPALPLKDLDRWLRERRQPRPVADSLAMFDGYITAIVVGPATYEPLGWICPLLGVSKDAYHDGDTPEFAAIAAVAKHHNALAATLSEKPDQFAPLFDRDATGAPDVGPWCRGFHAAIQLNPTFWRKLLPARRMAHLWLIPILAHCTRADGRPVPGAPPPGPLTELARFDADRTIPPAVVAMREFWAPSRYNRQS
jgi:uncharacterized protein